MKSLRLKKISPFIILISVTLLSISFLQAFPLLFSYRYTNSGLSFVVIHDSLWHLGIIEQLQLNFPPLHPGISGVSLINYHYFSDILQAILVSITGLPAWLVYFRIFPIISAVTFNLLVFVLAKKIFNKNSQAFTAMILTGLGGSLAWIIPVFIPGYSWHANSFMLDQPFDMLTNVHTYLGFALFICLILLSHQIHSHKKKSSSLQFLLIFLLPITYLTKSYSALIFLAGILPSLVLLYYKQKIVSKALFPILVSVVLMILIIILTTDSNLAGLAFSPGWLLDKMIQDSDRLPFLIDWLLRKQHYMANNDIPKLIFYTSLQFIAYLVGNFAYRILGLGFLTYLFIKHKYNFLTSALFFSTITSTTIPILFSQSQSAYNIVQFGQYALIITSIYTSVFIYKIITSPPKIFLISLLIILLSLPTTIKTFSDSYQQSLLPAQISNQHLTALAHLRNSTSTNSIVLTHPASIFTDYMIIPAISARQTYFSSPVFASITGVAEDYRFQQQLHFFDPELPINEKISFLKQANINYIYLETRHLIPFQSIQESLDLTVEFSNDQATVYKYNP